MQNNLPQDQYFATLPVEQLANAMELKVRAWRSWCAEQGLNGIWKKKLSNYYGLSGNGNSSQDINSGGTEGELTLIKVQELRPLIQQQLVTVTSQRPTGVARAVNSDPDSLRGSRIGTALAEYYMSNANFEASFVKAAEIALLCDESFVELVWDQDAGDPVAVDPMTGKPEMAGDAKLRVHVPWLVARDPGAPFEQQNWHILSFRSNRFDLMARFPKFEKEILIAADNYDSDIPLSEIPEGSDMTWVHLFMHARTPALPDGRYSLMIGQQVVLDTELPFKDYPLERMYPSEVIEGCTGYSSANDVMALEDATDAMHSLLLSNNTTFGGQSLIGPKGVEVNHNDLGKGMRYFELPPEHVDKLRPLQLTKSAPETYQYIDRLSNKKEQQLGSVSSILNAQAAQGASGASMALINAQSISFNSGVQRSYYRLLSSIMTKLIGILAKYADTPRVAQLVGKVKAQGLKEFKYTGKDLASVSSIVYEMVNPVLQSIGGRMTLAENLLKAGQCKDPKQYLNVALTGNLDVLTQNDEADEILILEENEALSEGKPVKAIVTENHANHIRSHLSTCSSVEAKKDPIRVTQMLAHCQEHLDLWMQASISNPGILMATGQQPLMPPPGMGMPGAPAPMPPEGGGGDVGKLAGDGSQPVMQQALEVNEPRMPINPATQQEAVVPGFNA